MSSVTRKILGESTIHLLRQVFDQLEEAVHMVDHKGRTVVYNQAAAQLDGLLPEEVMGINVLDAFPSLTRKTSTLLSVIETGKLVCEQQQSYMNRKGRQIVTINKTLPLFEEGVIVGAMEVAKDITSVKALSDEVLDLRKQVTRSVRRKVNSAQHKYHFSDIVTQDAAVVHEIGRAKRAAKTDSPILVVGETGTGKELIVQSIHSHSPRWDKPFVAQNCAAIPSALLEGILFGTVKGAFTGAEDRPGLFELAHGGTLFLDEIQAMPIDIQAKLLRALEERFIRRVGGVKVHPVDVRVVVATNEDPLESIREARLRKDLYYRIHVVRIQLPPLRERKGDISLLVEYFMSQLTDQYAGCLPVVGHEALQILEEYDWPGNVRELKHTLEGVVITHESRLDSEERFVLTPGDFPIHMQKQRSISSVSLSGEGSLRDKLREVERELIQKALQSSSGNLVQAAKHLGVPRQTLQYKLRKLKE